MIVSGKPLERHKIDRLDQTTKQNRAKPSLHFFSYGRQALRYAIDQLFMKTTPHILVPALFCNSALELCGSAQITHYDCTTDGDVDPDQICRMVATGEFEVLVINHLFGRTPAGRAQIYAACQRHDVIMIDDMCHCPLRSLQAGDDDDYDVRVFSFRKFLPVPAGGAAQLHPRFQTPAPTGPIAMPASAMVKFMIERLVFALGWRWVWRIATSGRAGTGVSSPPQSGGDGVVTLPPARNLSPRLARVLGLADHRAAISRHRQAHHATLAKITAPFGGVFAAGDVPQNFAILDPSGRLAQRMRAAGIACYNWPATELPASVRTKSQTFPNAVRVADSILCIPIHQDVTDAQIMHIADVLRAHKAGEGVR